MKTQKRWIGKGADLDVLTENVERFFNGRGFKTRREPLPGGHRISVVTQHVRNVRGAIKVTILGHSNDFLVELSVGGPSRFSTLLGLSTTLFGGGALVLRGLKLREALERLEKDFWAYVEKTIADMTVLHDEANA